MERAETMPASLPTEYGLHNYGWYAGGQLFRGHAGAVDGFSAEYGYARASGIGYALVVNQHASTAAVNALRAAIVEALAPQPMPRPVDKPADLEWAGTYRDRWPRFSMASFRDDLIAWRHFTVEGDRLVMRTLGGRSTLGTFAADAYGRANEPGPDVRFYRDDGQRRVIIDGQTLTEASLAWCASRMIVAVCLVAAPLLVLVTLLFALARRTRPYARALTFSALGAATLVIALLAIADLDSMALISRINPQTIAFCAFPPLAGVLALAGLVGRGQRGLRVFGAIIVLTPLVHLAAYGMLGFRAWAF
jgi:hypothetical protein